MAFSSTTDTRNHVMGDMVMMTGTFDAASVDTGTIDLSDTLSKIFACGVTGDTFGDVTGGGIDGAFAIVTTASPNQMILDCVASNTGTWWAIGQR
jgi:hypothetical protein|tara:strand:+ start:2761 stop:3045 length:285 start_codon:yes stop_codon:yes gene_type:complete